MMGIQKDWSEMSEQERGQLEEEWSATPGMIDYVVAHLHATPEDVQAAARVLQEIKVSSDPSLWRNVAPEELLYLLAKKGRKTD